MKKMISLLIICGIFLTGCSESSESDKIEVMTTVYPVYSMTKLIGGDYVNVETVYPAGADPHSYELTSQEIKEIADSDLFLYVDDEMESYALDLQESGDYQTEFINISHQDIIRDGIGSEYYNEDDNLINPHIWTTPQNDMLIAQVIYQKLSTVDSEHQDYYQENYQQLIDELTVLDQEYQDFANSQTKTIIVPNDAFYYLEEDYQIEMLMVSQDEEAEPSAKDLATIEDVINNEEINYIFTETEDESNPYINNLANETDTQVLVLDNLETVSQETLDNEVSVVDILANNLAKMKENQ